MSLLAVAVCLSDAAMCDPNALAAMYIVQQQREQTNANVKLQAHLVVMP